MKLANNIPKNTTDSLGFLLLNEVAIIDQLAQTEAAQILAPELNMPQFIVLNHLVRRGQEASMVSLASAIQVTKGAMSNTVTRLQVKGLINVRSDPKDGRGKLVSISLAGQKVRALAVQRLTAGLKGLDAVLTDGEQAQMLALLEKVRIWFDAKRN